jgi:hypothetical protein
VQHIKSEIESVLKVRNQWNKLTIESKYCDMISQLHLLSIQIGSTVIRDRAYQFWHAIVAENADATKKV